MINQKGMKGTSVNSTHFQARAMGSYSWWGLVLTNPHFGRSFYVRQLWVSLVGATGTNHTSVDRCHISRKEVGISTSTHSGKKPSWDHKMRMLEADLRPDKRTKWNRKIQEETCSFTPQEILGP